jgi:hypothetical protein
LVCIEHGHGLNLAGPIAPISFDGFLSSIVKNDNCVSSESSRLLDGHGFIYLFRLIVDEDT